MKGLTYNNTEGAQELIEELAKWTFRMSSEIRAITESHSIQTTEDELDRVLNIRASFLLIKQQANIVQCWNLYFVEDPGLDEDEYKLL